MFLQTDLTTVHTPSHVCKQTQYSAEGLRVWRIWRETIVHLCFAFPGTLGVNGEASSLSQGVGVDIGVMPCCDEAPWVMLRWAPVCPLRYLVGPLPMAIRSPLLGGSAGRDILPSSWWLKVYIISLQSPTLRAHPVTWSHTRHPGDFFSHTCTGLYCWSHCALISIVSFSS